MQLYNGNANYCILSLSQSTVNQECLILCSPTALLSLLNKQAAPLSLPPEPPGPCRRIQDLPLSILSLSQSTIK